METKRCSVLIDSRAPRGRWALRGAAIAALFAGCAAVGGFTVVTPLSLHFTVAPGQVQTEMQLIELVDEAVDGDSCRALCDVEWIYICRPSPRPAGEAPAWGVWVLPSGLAEGTYTATVRIEDGDGVELACVSVTLTVKSIPTTVRGVIMSSASTPVPRHVGVGFVHGSAPDEMLATIEAFGARVVEVFDWWQEHYIVEIPLGHTLDEAVAFFESSPLVDLASPYGYGCGCLPDIHVLVTESDDYYHLVYEDLEALREYEREWIVEVSGIDGGSSIIVDRITPVEPNYLTVVGTIILAGPSDTRAILVEENGEAWELAGPAGEAVAELPLGVKDVLTVTGIDKGVFRDAYSGGLRLEVAWFFITPAFP